MNTSMPVELGSFVWVVVTVVVAAAAVVASKLPARVPVRIKSGRGDSRRR